MTPEHFKDLERRCHRMRLKRRVKIAFISFFSFLIGVMCLHVTMNFDFFEKRIFLPNNTIDLEAKSESDQSEQNSKEMHSSYRIQEKQNAATSLESRVPSTDNKPSTEQNFSTIVKPKEMRLLNNTYFLDEEVLIENFNASKGFNEALALAHYYFEKNEHVKAILWAKESSKIKPISDEPWIIYAKSKFSLGERVEAVRSLELISRHINSKDINKLLDFYKGQQ